MATVATHVRQPLDEGRSNVANEVQVVTTNVRSTAVIAWTTTWEEFPSLWMQRLDRVYACLKINDAIRSGHNVMLYKGDTPNVEVGVAVTGVVPASGEVIPSTLPAGRAAMILHRGPYDQLKAVHQTIRAWCTENGHPIAGSRWEVYDDWHADPTQLETEVYYLLAGDPISPSPT